MYSILMLRLECTLYNSYLFYATDPSRQLITLSHWTESSAQETQKDDTSASYFDTCVIPKDLLGKMAKLYMQYDTWSMLVQK